MNNDAHDTSLMRLPSMELTQDSFLPERRNARSPKQLARSYDSHSQTESYRANLTAEAMGHTAKLVQLANQIGEKVPEAEQPCRSIALGYALSATARIMKF